MTEREKKFRNLLKWLRSQSMLDSAGIMMAADTIATLWTEQRKFYNNRFLRTRRFFDEMLDHDGDDDTSVTSTGNVTGNSATSTGNVTGNSVTSTGNVTEVINKEREAERGSTPHTPLKEKGEGKEIALPLRVSAAPAPACTYVEERPDFVPPGETRAPAPAEPPERTDVPPLHIVLASCDITGVSKTYARWWYGQMAASGWVTTKGQRID
nr:hypothetical protein [Kiritimatiellia bacterium]